MHTLLIRSFALAATLLLSACAGYSPAGLPPGTTEADVLKAMGPPQARHTLPEGGSRLEYSRGPMGVHTFMLDMNAQGRLQRWEQVLDTPGFDRVRPGMSQAELLRVLGRPAQRLPLAFSAQVWSWRYANNDCLWFRVDITAEGVVKNGGSFGIDPICDAPSDRE